MKKFKIILVTLVVLAFFALPSFAASITPSTKTFDLAKPKDWTFTVTDVPTVGMLIFYGDDIQLVGQAGGFTYDGTTLTVQGSVIRGAILEHVGQYSIFKMKLYPSEVSVTFTVTDSGAKTISPTSAAFNISSPQDLIYTLTNVDNVGSVNIKSQDGKSVGSTTDFTYADNALTLKGSVLAKFLTNEGTYYLIPNDEAALQTTVTVTKSESSGGGGGGGCNAGIEAILLLCCIIPFTLRKKDNLCNCG